jgi:hypothetical protein
MQLIHFKEFIGKVISEGNRLQKRDVNGKVLTTKKLSQTQLLSFALAIILLLVLKKGFTDNFAGYTISFLGIFIGLFTNIIISMYDKSKSLMIGYSEKDEIEKAKTKQIRNYLVQFTGLTSYSILLALVCIVLLLISLSNGALKNDIMSFSFINSFKEINFTSLKLFLGLMFLISYRFSVVYILSNFFIITIFSITSYFTFLLSEYKKLINNYD